MSSPFGDNPDNLPPPADLSAEDAAALDAFIQAGFDASAVPPELRDRAGNVASLLGLLNHHNPIGDTDSLVDATLARIRLASEPSGVSAPAEYTLTANDEDAFESLVTAEYVAEAVPTVLRRRASRHAEMLALLEPTEQEVVGAHGRGHLISRTLARVQSAIEGQERRLQVEHAPIGGRRLRTADLMTAAALLLIGTAAVGPMVGAMRQQSRRTACQAGLGLVGSGFGAYANEFKDAMPMASASIAGNPWWFVGKPEQSNSANMFTLARTGYTKLDDMACPGNPTACRSGLDSGARDWRNLEEVSYSYQNMFGRHDARLHNEGSGNRFLVMVDGSPVVRRAVRGQWINPLANSMNHAGKGQNALFSDGGVVWMSSPVLDNGDNIWLPRVLEEALAKRGQPTQAEPIKGTETPATPDDRFVGP